MDAGTAIQLFALLADAVAYRMELEAAVAEHAQFMAATRGPSAKGTITFVATSDPCTRLRPGGKGPVTR